MTSRLYVGVPHLLRVNVFQRALQLPVPLQNYLALLVREAVQRHVVLQSVNFIRQRWCSWIMDICRAIITLHKVGYVVVSQSKFLQISCIKMWKYIFRYSIYRVIHKTFRDFRTRLRNNQDRQCRKEHINRQRISPSFFFFLGALTYFQVPPLGGNRD